MPRSCRGQDTPAILSGSITKLAPLLVQSWRPFFVSSGKQDSMLTKIDHNELTDVWEHCQE